MSAANPYPDYADRHSITAEQEQAAELAELQAQLDRENELIELEALIWAERMEQEP